MVIIIFPYTAHLSNIVTRIGDHCNGRRFTEAKLGSLFDQMTIVKRSNQAGECDELLNELIMECIKIMSASCRELLDSLKNIYDQHYRDITGAPNRHFLINHSP